MAPTNKTSDKSGIDFDAKTPDDSGSVDKVHIFTMHGQDYFIPRKPRIAVGLRYMKNIRTLGDAHAQAMFLEEVLGEEAYEALIAYDDLTADDLSRVVEIATSTVFGALDDPKATSQRGTRK